MDPEILRRAAAADAAARAMASTKDNQITLMVEDFLRAFLIARLQQGKQAGAEVKSRFQQQINVRASALPANQRRSFITAVENERTALLREYNANPAGTMTRLGIASHIPNSGNRMGLGDVAVRTAVRAAVFETVLSVFR